MTCHECVGLLSAYADGELALEESREVERHLCTCKRCRHHFESTRALKHGIARLRGRDEPPAAVQARIETAELQFRRAGRTFRFAIAAAVAFIVAGVALVGYVRQRQADVTGALVSDHFRSLPAITPPHLISDDPRAVARYFEGRTPFRPFVPALRDATLVGARLCNINGRKAELLFYDVSGSTVSFFVCPIDAVTMSRGCRTRDGAIVCSGTKDGLSIHVVGALSQPQLERLVADATSL